MFCMSSTRVTHARHTEYCSTPPSQTENKIAGYIVRFADGKYYAWNLNKISEITDYIKWRQQLLPRNTHFGDNTLIKKEVGDLFLNEAVLLYEETKQKEQSNA